MTCRCKARILCSIFGPQRATTRSSLLPRCTMMQWRTLLTLAHRLQVRPSMHMFIAKAGTALTCTFIDRLICVYWTVVAVRSRFDVFSQGILVSCMVQ